MAESKPGNSIPWVLGVGVFAALKYFQVWAGQQGFETPFGYLPIAGETAQILVAVLSALAPQFLPALEKIPGVGAVLAMGKHVEQVHNVIVKKQAPEDQK